jgi:hypothetical protein
LTEELSLSIAARKPARPPVHSLRGLNKKETAEEGSILAASLVVPTSSSAAALEEQGPNYSRVLFVSVLPLCDCLRFVSIDSGVEIAQGSHA